MLERDGPKKSKYTPLVKRAWNKRFPTITEVISNTLSSSHKCVEPKERMVAGVFTYACHRFPIKGGMSYLDLMCINITKNNSLLRMLKEDGKVKRG